MNTTATNDSSEVASSSLTSEANEAGSGANNTTTAVATASSSKYNAEAVSGPAVSNESNCLTPTANASIKRIIRQVTPSSPGVNPTDTQSPVATSSNLPATPTGSSQKRVIRKITPIDPKKLQQAGLDRKIAEALSKQKSLQGTNKITNRILNNQTKATPTVSSVAATNVTNNVKLQTKPLNTEEQPSPAKPLLLAKNIIPPKITITAPDPQPDLDTPELAGLNSQQRLVHVKNLLNKKLMEKKNSPNNDKPKMYIHLKPPPPLTGSLITTTSPLGPKLPMKPPPSSKKDTPNRSTASDPRGYTVLKEPAITTPPLKSYKTKTPQKSPQDIARKLDFQMEDELKITHQQPAKRTYIKFNTMDKMDGKKATNFVTQHSGTNVIPKAAIKAGQHQQQNDNNSTNFTSFEHSGLKLNSQEKLSPTTNNMATDFSTQTKDINRIPKATIKTGHQQLANTSLDTNTTPNFRFFQHAEQSLIIPNSTDVIPLRTSYIAANAGTAASVKPNYNQPPQNIRYFQNLEHKTDYSHVMSTKSNMASDYQSEYLKQQRINYQPKTSTTSDYSEIPKAAIKAGNSNQQYSYLPYSYKQLKHSEQKLDFPEVSPLKVPFPTVNVPKETPLPTIDSFKKPYPTAGYYDLQAQTQNLHKILPSTDFINTNYESFLNPTNPTSLINNNLLPSGLETNENVVQTETESNNSPNANCLIVLENKILSQDEMIDLTELRLSNSNTPRFINPHKPIPELVIKQEKADEYPTTNTPPEALNTNTQEMNLNQDEIPSDITTENKEKPSCDKVCISNGPNKKIIINAQKLKLPPEQLADLAKKIKARTAVITTPASKQETKPSDMRILNTKAGIRKVLTPLSSKHTAYVLPKNPTTEKDNSDVSTSNNNHIINNKANYTEPYKQDHNYQLKMKSNIAGISSLNKETHSKSSNNVATENTEMETNKSEDISLVQVKEEPKTLDNNDKTQQNFSEVTPETANFEASPYMDSSFTDYRQSAVEIIDEPMETEDCFSAVDFITALNNSNPITEETSLELSPEELNLNASCTMNNFSPLRIQSYPPQRHRTTSASFKVYATNPEQMSTIVIESSKGPETILTNESPNKYGALQKVKLLNNMGMCDMDIEKPLDNENKDSSDTCKKQQHLVLEPLKEPKNIDLTNVIVASDPNKIKLIISQVSQEKEEEILNTDKLASPNKMRSPRKAQTLSVQNLPDDNQTSSIESNDFTTLKEVATNLSKTPSKSIENVEKPQEIAVASKSSTEDIQLKESKASKIVTVANASLTKEHLKSPLKVTNLKSILKSPIIDLQKDNSNSTISKETLITKPAESDSSVKSSSIQETSAESEATKANETATVTTTTTAVTTKRISRFKKGKINLVQRNKVSAQSTNKPTTGEKHIEATNKDNKVDKESKSNEALDEPAKEEKRAEVTEVNQESIQINETPIDSIKTNQSPTKSNANTQTKSRQVQQGEEVSLEGKSTPQIADKPTDAESNVTITTGDKENQEKVENSNEIPIDKSDDSITKTIITKGVSKDSAETLENKEIANQATPKDMPSDKATRSPDKSYHNTLIAETKENNAKFPQKFKTQDEANHLQDISEVTPQKVQATNTKVSTEPENISKSPEKLPKSSEISEISTPQKSPQNIARKLDFEAVKETEEALEQEQAKESKTVEKKPEESKSTQLQQEETVNATLEQTLNQHKQRQQTTATTNVEESNATETNENLIELNEIQDNIENISCESIAKQTQLNRNDDLDLGSRNILKSMRNAKVSLIDIVKHSPIKTPELKPVIPFKKKTPDTKEPAAETKGIKTLIKQLKSHNKDKEAQEPGEDKAKEMADQPETSVKVTRRSLTKVNDENQNSKIVYSKRSTRLSLNEKPIVAQTTAAKPAGNSRKRHSTRPLISDDDLEFLPVNAEVKFKLSKSKGGEKDKTIDTVTSDITTPTSSNPLNNRRTRLYSKPLEMDLSKHSSPLTKRTRYYSQTLETNVTISFDALKSDTIANVSSPLNRLNLNSLDTEDSCQDSTQDSKKLTPTRQRKKLRKTLEDIKKSQKSLTDTDSEDERDYDDACLKDCEEGSEFLGFEENNDTSFKNIPTTNKQVEANDKVAKTKGGTMKNWLTTGKAIAPTLEDEQLNKRIRHDDELPATTRSRTSGGLKPFKKRWDLSSNRHEETDITDDTSPADDEDESAAEQITNIRKYKRGIKNVIDSNKVQVDSKKLKLDETLEKTPEHRFIKPQHLRTMSKNSGTDSEMLIPTELSSDHDSAKVNVAETVNETSATDSDNTERRTSRRSRCHNKDVDKLNEISGTDSDRHQGKDTRHLSAKVKSKDKSIEKHSGNSAIDSDCQNKTETRQPKSKEKLIQNAEDKSLEKSKKFEDNDSSNQEARGSKRPQSKTKVKGADNNLKTNNSGSDCPNSTESSPIKSQSNIDGNHNINDLGKGVKPQENTQDSKSMKSKENAEDLDISHKSQNFESNESKVKRAKILKSKLTTDDDTEQKLNITENHDELDSSHNKDKSTKNILNNSKNEINTNELSKQGDISTTVLECKAETSSPAIKTPQNKTSKKKTGKTKLKTEQTSNADTTEESFKDTPTSSVVRTLKRSLSTDSSDDEVATSSAKKRSQKNQPKRKLKIEDSDSDSTAATPLKKDDGKENNIDNLTPITTPRLALVKNETPRPRAGRKRKNLAECNFNSRLLLITKREQLDTEEVLTGLNIGSGPIKCGLCLNRTSKWTLHLAEHYGVGWQDGQEILNVGNRSVVLNCILSYLKKTGSKGLACRMCKKEYRSGLGMLTHIESCGVQIERVICEYCKRDYAPSTLPIHVRSCYAKIALESPSNDCKLEENVEKHEEVFGNTGRLKRNSTIKAENKLKVLGEELEKAGDTTNNDKTDIDPKSRIRYVPPLDEENTTKKWTQDIKKLGKAVCPKKRCKFSSNNLKELSDHLKNCKHIRSGYFCNFCRRRAFKTEKEAVEHVIKSHKGGRRKSDDSDCNLKTDDEQSSDDNDLSEGVDENEVDLDASEEEDDYDDAANYGKKGRKKQSKKSSNRNGNQTNFQSCRKKVYEGRSNDVTRDVFTKWKNFLKLNYSKEPLYNEFTTQYSVLNQKDFMKYLPKQTVSMKFNFKAKAALTPVIGEPQTNIEWSELRRYESVHNKYDTYYFLGAPVKLCSWLPLPAHVNEQYLAVVYRQDMFKFVKFTQPTQHHTVILIMKVTQKNQKPQLDIHYGFVVPDGPVHHVSFLPSGGYDESSNRLGLVAVATVSSAVKIYSLPLNIEGKVIYSETNNYNEDITLIEVKPSFLLNLDLLHKQQHVLLDTQCLQICWSEFNGHQHIFASFANGFIGIWDITNDLQQNLNRFVENDIINYAPLNYFYVGEKSVKCFALHYDTSGPRWLAVSGAYRKFLIFDIKCFMQPMIMREEVNKNILLSMDWCPLWETLLYSYGDDIPNNGRCAMAVNPTNLIFPQSKLDFMVCGVTQVHYTPVTNMCVTTLENGDIVFLDTRELHYECPVGKKFGERRMLCAMDVKKLDGKPLARLPKGNEKNLNVKVPTEWSMHDENYKEKYGLVFEPLLKLKEEHKSDYLSDKRCPPTNIIPLMRINTLRCNLNLNAKNLIVVGYESGFLRLVNFNKERDIC
ncbi:Zinc finger protein 512 [Lucilia cuprina]|nr:Zinc finger protein 512 [Lucilia cuprina]